MANEKSTSDGYVRIPISVLPTISLRHLVSGVDPSIATVDPRVKPTVTGFTEWVGAWNTMTITVGWDWGVLHGSVVVINPGEIRSNVRLVSDNCQSVQKALSETHMLKWIESMPWRDIATRDLFGQRSS
jgi:hypothetical protein